MPLKRGITVDDVIKAVCHECCSPPREPRDEIDSSCINSVSNAGYFILREMGFTHEEIVEKYAAARKVKYAKDLERKERKRKREERMRKGESATVIDMASHKPRRP
jgi:hypothetical protein